MIHSINHQTVFEYATTQKSVVQRLHLKPLGTTQQHLMDWDVEVNGGKIVLETVDYHGNAVHLCNQYSDVEKIEITHRGRVRRAKLYYLRGLAGKKARLRERDSHRRTAGKKN